MLFALLAQGGIAGILAALLGIWQGQTAALSALLGGLVAVVPNAFLGARLMSAAPSAKAVLRAAWLGEIGKLVLTALLFGVVFALVRPIAPLAVFAGFIAAQLVIFGALALGGGAGNNETTIKS